ncbi:MAG TPA: MBL fold metallo-hydrolase [bacterium]|nr:MBL fold metallo-hydrolase [bacterium]
MKKLLLLVLNFGILLFFLLVLALKWPVEAPAGEPSSFAPRAKMDSLPELSFRVFETGYSESLEAFAVRGGSLLKNHRYTHSAVLIEHPKGRVVLDSGLGTSYPAELASMSGAVGFFVKKTFHATKPLKNQADFPRLDPAKDFFLVSHAHWDHLGGMADFELPIRLLAEEKDFMLAQGGAFQHGVLPIQVEKLKDRLVPLVLESKPYENFARSLDLFGDGSLVVVSLSGHTPGSLGLFANLPSGKRFLFVGDALWSVDAEGKPQARSWAAERFSDFDPLEARKIRVKLGELIRHSNEIKLVPVHDAKALALVTQSD